MRYFAIRTENLTKNYGRRRGIENLILEVEPGEIYGLLGPDNAGKSTVVRLLLDYSRPSSGTAYVLGMDCFRQNREIRQRVGFIPSEFSLYNHMTGYDFLRHMARQRGLNDLTQACEMAERFAISLNRRILLMQPDEKKKLGLVQAFMLQPELYIFDEPTQGLDRESQLFFYKLVSAARAEGSAVFFTTANLLEAERLCDRVGILRNGTLIAVERGVHLRARSMRRIEMRFADPVTLDEFQSLTNIDDLRLEDNKISCTVHGEPDGLIKLASQHRVTDFISQQISLEEALASYYGRENYAY